jgi:acyl-homoserine lactone acylase PvdQ
LNFPKLWVGLLIVFLFLFCDSNQKDLTWQETLLGWDGNELYTSQEATLFEEFTSCLYNVTFYEIGYGWSDPYFGARVFNNATADGTGDDISCSYWNQTCLSYASYCFSLSVAKYPIRIPDFGALPHYAVFPHVLPFPAEGYSRAVSIGGSPYTPNAAHPIGPRGPILAGPSMRMISDMSGTVPNQIVLPMGESGVPTSPHYDDQLAAWAADQLYVMDWNYL